MDFVLNTYHKDIPDEELLNDILRVAKQCNVDRLSQPKYEQYGKYSGSTICKRFGGWNTALSKIGLNPYKQYTQNHEKCLNSDDFFSDMRNIASMLQKDFITTGEYECYGKYDYSTMFRQYGSWSNILKLAGLSQTPYRTGKGKLVTDEELFQEIECIWIKLGRQPTMTDVRNGLFSHGSSTYARHFGSWRGALEAFVRYINEEDNINLGENVNYIDTKVIENQASYIATNQLKHKTSRDINLRLRFKVMQRDNFKCCICGKSPATSPNVTLHIDHIKPWSKGGETTIDNLQTLCSDCNLGKSDLYDE